MNKKLYTKNYEVRQITLPNGSVREEVIYKGEYYCPQWTPKQKTAAKVGASVLVGCAAALFVLIGLLNTEGSRRYYVLLPFLLTSFPTVFEVFAVFRLWFSEDKMTIDVFHNSLLRLRKSSAAAAVIAAVGVAGDMIFLFSDPANHAADEQLFLLGVCGLFAVHMALFLMIRRIRHKILPNAANEKNEFSDSDYS